MGSCGKCGILQITEMRMKKLLLIFVLLINIVQAQQPGFRLELTSQLGYQSELNDIWAYVAQDGTEYALVGTVTGLSIVSLQDPSNPIETHFVAGAATIWRDIKTFGDYAYVSNEGSNGLAIIDLSDLPNSVTFKDTVINGAETIHNLWIDEEGYLYAVGLDKTVANGGMLIMDLNSDPWNPELVGIYNDRYVHDVYVRNGLAYCAELRQGLTIVDVSEKSSPTAIGNVKYEGAFTHNTWLSDDSNVCFTTDEKNRAFVIAWDVSDPQNIKELDRIKSSLSAGLSLPHNVHVKDDFLVNSYYKDGIIVVDASRPTNLVTVGYYDTSPLSGSGTDGCWGAYPFLPSGLILASDIQLGLFVLSPSYGRAAHLEGKVIDASTGLPLEGVELSIPQDTSSTDEAGSFAMGSADTGTFQLIVNKHTYIPDTLEVSLQAGELTEVLIELAPQPLTSISLSITDERNGLPLEDARVTVLTPKKEIFTTYEAKENGIISIDSLPNDKYEIVAGLWGFRTGSSGLKILSSMDQSIISLKPGHYDDFLFDWGWQVVENSEEGNWERAIPSKTTIFDVVSLNPGFDYDQDFGPYAYVTGNQGETFEDDDVDKGSTSLISPPIDLNLYTDPVLEYRSWFVNYIAFSTVAGEQKGEASFSVFLSDAKDTLLAGFRDDVFGNSWKKSPSGVLIRDFFPFADSIQVIVKVENPDSLTVAEAGFDQFQIRDELSTSLQSELSEEKSILQMRFNRQDSEINLLINKKLGIAHSFEIYDLHGNFLTKIQLKPEEIQYNLTFSSSHGLYMGLLRKGKNIIETHKFIW